MSKFISKYFFSAVLQLCPLEKTSLGVSQITYLQYVLYSIELWVHSEKQKKKKRRKRGRALQKKQKKKKTWNVGHFMHKGRATGVSIALFKMADDTLVDESKSFGTRLLCCIFIVIYCIPASKHIKYTYLFHF